MVSLMVILFCTKYYLFVYMYIDLLNVKAYKLKIVKLTSPGFFFKEANLYMTVFTHVNLLFSARHSTFTDSRVWFE